MKHCDPTLSGHPSIVSVDDQGSSLEQVCAVLGDLHLDCRSFRDGAAALAAMTVSPPDVLITDAFMPGMDGFELIAQARRRFPRTRIIAVSGALDLGEGVDCAALRERLGADFLLAKPLDAVALRGALAAAFDSFSVALDALAAVFDATAPLVLPAPPGPAALDETHP